MSFWSPEQTLFPFQMDGVAKVYWTWTQAEAGEQSGILNYDTGLGKTPCGIALACFLLEDDLIDHVVLVVEANKCLDWVETDFPKFSTLEATRYAGTPKKRKAILDDLPRVLVMSYETARQDLCSFRKTRSGDVADEPKMLAEALQDKRLLIVFDEFSRLRNRKSKTYLGWEFLINRMMKKNRPYKVGLTATMVERDPEDYWNAGRLLSPERAGAVGDFNKNYVSDYDGYGNASKFKNLTPDDCEPGVLPLNQMFSGITVRRRKTDPDVMEQFPAKVENPPIMVELSSGHMDLYNAIEEMFQNPDLDPNTQRIGFGILRQLVNHPASLVRTTGKYSQNIVNIVGASQLEAMQSAKLQAMLDWQERMQDQQTIMFTFYGQSVLPYIEHALRSKDYKVSVNHGGMSQEERKRSQDAFKAGDTQIFLSSDAGARGLNLGNGSGLLHYENPVLWAIYEQRSNRLHRLDSIHPSVTIDALVAKDTLEVPITRLMLKRAGWGEQIQDSDYCEDEDISANFLTAADRMGLLRKVL